MFRGFLFESSDVGVELRLICRSQRSAELTTLGLHDLLALLSLRGTLLPERLERRAIAALTRVAHRLHVGLRLLASCLHLGCVLLANDLEVRFFGVAQCDALEEPSLTAKTYFRMSARKKIGVDIPTRDTTRLV